MMREREERYSLPRAVLPNRFFYSLPNFTLAHGDEAEETGDLI